MLSGLSTPPVAVGEATAADSSEESAAQETDDARGIIGTEEAV